MKSGGGDRSDSIVLLFSALAVIVAATISMATIRVKNHSFELESPDPFVRAEKAALAGIEAAKWHIECHGRLEKGSLSPRYHINGGTYYVRWDDVDLADSTVMVRSKGEFSWGNGERYYAEVESKVKLEFLPEHNQQILDAYYSQERSISPVPKGVSKTASERE